MCVGGRTTTDYENTSVLIQPPTDPAPHTPLRRHRREGIVPLYLYWRTGVLSRSRALALAGSLTGQVPEAVGIVYPLGRVGRLRGRDGVYVGLCVVAWRGGVVSLNRRGQTARLVLCTCNCTHGQ